MSNWELIESIIDSVLLLPEDERENYINDHYSDNEQLRSDVLELLNSIEESDYFFDGALSAKENVFSQFAHKNVETEKNNCLVGTTIGKYEIVELINHGGMGTVYKAERNDGVYDQTVALKLIRHGMDTPRNISRFEKERFILAGLNHPHIAGLVDGGVTDFGLPYLVMEYVDGMPIDDYCDKNSLNIKERIELFKTICETVQFAHNNMIIHRDLKPDNIFIDSNGFVKILDFGIAKLLEDGLMKGGDDAEQTHQVLTPSTAAPEQVKCENVTTATDTYALGILLFKLLTGIAPFNFDGLSLNKKKDIIVNKVPPLPSQAFISLDIDRQNEISLAYNQTPLKHYNLLSGDIDAIISKALRKEKEFRYQTANDLLADLDRYLNNRPVIAHHGHYRYKIKKFLRRNYKSFSTAAAIVLMITSFSIYHTIQISEERNHAQIEAQKAIQVTNMLFNLFEASDPDVSMVEPITAHELLNRGVQRAQMLNEQPAVKAQMYHVIGQIYYRLGDFEQASPLILDAISLYKSLFGEDHPETAYTIASLGALQSAEGNYKIAEHNLRRALEIYTKDNIIDYTKLANIKSDLAYTMRRQGDFVTAEEMFRHGHQLLDENLGSNHLETLNFKNSLATTLFNIGKYAEAEEIYREVLPERITALGLEHPAVAETKSSLGALMMVNGLNDEAYELLNNAYSIRSQKLGEDHPRTLLTKNNLAILNRDLGHFDISERIFGDVLEARIELMGANHTSTAISQFSLAELFVMQQRYPEARALLKQAVSTFEDSFSNMHSFTVRSQMTLAYVDLLDLGVNPESSAIESEYKKLLSIHHEHTLERAIADHQLGVYFHKKGDFALADSLLRKSDETYSRLLNSATTRQIMVKNDLELLRSEFESDVQYSTFIDK